MIVVVSGLPRSGTSMMMQMLGRGGLDPVTDEERPADESNPRGYFEDERARSLGRGGNADWLSEAEGRAVKVIAPLLQKLPEGHDYRVIFMERDLGEILASQQKMLERLGKPTRPAEVLRPVFEKQQRQAHAWLEAHDRAERIAVPHRRTIEAPQEQARRVAGFLEAHPAAPFDPERMAAAVDPDLYRERVAAE